MSVHALSWVILLVYVCMCSSNTEYNLTLTSTCMTVLAFTRELQTQKWGSSPGGRAQHFAGLPALVTASMYCKLLNVHV